jgi:AraC-like DNA-binding protein
MFFIIGIFIAVFLFLLLLIKKNKSRADKILVIWLIFISINQILRYFTVSGYFFKYPHWLGLELALPVLHGVLLYFYVIEITGNAIQKKGVVFLHFVPTIILVLLTIPFYQITGEEKVFVFQNDGKGFEWYLMIQSTVIAISGLVYSIWSLIIINRHQRRIKDRFSNTDKKELQWLKYLSIGNGIIFILSVFFSNEIIYTAVVSLVLFMGFFGINQMNIFYSATAPEKVLEQETETANKSKGVIKPKSANGKYEKSGLNEEMASKIYTNLNTLVKENAIYKNEQITLVELAKQLQAHPNHLSQVINEKEGKNFYNYINSLRIKEFIKLASLPENKKYTMISLAYDCGFSTKSTFNKHFKLQTGKTPTQFFRS